jgi:hypothetical protein
MSEAEKQESQKTVVSFITGLLIGGLLVWIFSSTPEEEKQLEKKTEKTDTEQTTKKEDVKSDTTAKTEGAKTGQVEMKKIEVGEGKLTVPEQDAGASIVLGEVKLPTKSGWIVVRDDVNGVPGNILGAARYNADEGLMPTMVELIRSTVSGKSYQAMFYTEEGTVGFALGEDKPIDGTAVTFKVK